MKGKMMKIGKTLKTRIKMMTRRVGNWYKVISFKGNGDVSCLTGQAEHQL